MIETVTVFRKCPDTRYRNIGGEGIVVRQTAGEVLVLNGIGARVLDLLESGIAVAGVLNALAAEYDVDRSTLERDLLAYFQELLDAGIIEVAAA